MKRPVSMFVLLLVGAGCSYTGESESESSRGTESEDSTGSADSAGNGSTEGSGSAGAETTAVLAGSVLDVTAMFTERDMVQMANTSGATQLALVSGQDVTITEAGVYLVSGSAEDSTIVVDADDEAKVQLVLDGVYVKNSDAPVVYVKSADKVFVTTADGDNRMEVSGTYVADGETNLDAAIFSKDDLVLNGIGSLEVISTQGNGITSKDDLKITGGTLLITSALDGLEANDSIRIAGGAVTVESAKDALHSENGEDDSLGYIYVSGGTLDVTAADDGIRGTSAIQIDGGTIDVITSIEGIEATYIQLNDGDISVYASDDGINATSKSAAYNAAIEVNGGRIFVEVGSGDTDAFDANGDIFINGGTIDIVAPTSAFDFDNVGELNGGTVTVNGSVVTQLTGGGPGGGHRPFSG